MSLARATYLIIVLAAPVAYTTSCQSDPRADPDFEFLSGAFTISTQLADDRCLDGGLNPLFMPLGDTQPWQWPFPITVYDPSELPKTYVISLREPFNDMTVTATQSIGRSQRFVAQTNPRVELGPDRFGDCVVELDGVVNINLVDSNTIEGIASLQLSNPRGDERCPADMPPTCEVLLGFEGARLQGN